MNKRRFEIIRAVSVFGYADTQPGEQLYEEAKEVSRVLAEEGMTVINGGGPGVMRASTEGAHQGGGKAYIATFYSEKMETFEGKDPLNEADKELAFDSYLERTLKLLELGNAYVVFNGGTGTVSEFAMAWGLAKLYLGRHKPLILYGEFWHEIMESFAANMNIRPAAMRVYRIATRPEEALEALWYYEKELEKGKHEVIHSGENDFEKAFTN